MKKLLAVTTLAVPTFAVLLTGCSSVMMAAGGYAFPHGCQSQRGRTICERLDEQGGSPSIEAYIKDHMMNPKSYEYAGSRCVADEEDYLLIETTFHGSNAYGGVVPSRCVVKINYQAELLEVVWIGR